jgi:hypothetical protein
VPSISSLASALTPGLAIKTSPVYIVELKDDDTPDSEKNLRFQYFPDTISDTKGINWVPKEIPGGSLPLYQWVSSGARTISFTAVFTTDVDFSNKGQGSANASIALLGRLSGSGNSHRNIDIRGAVYWLRRFMLPRYGNDTAVGVPLTKAPHKLQLHMPGTGIGRAGGGGGGSCSRDWMTCIMTGCDVNWEAFFPSGFPRLATVSLSFTQVAQFRGQVAFPSASKLDDDVFDPNGAKDLTAGADFTSSTGDSAGFTFGYSLKPTEK